MAYSGIFRIRKVICSTQLMRLLLDVKTQFNMLATIIDNFQSTGTGLNPENVTLVLEEASRRLGDEVEGKDLQATEKKSFKQTVKLPVKQSSLPFFIFFRLIW